MPVYILFSNIETSFFDSIYTDISNLTMKYLYDNEKNNLQYEVIYKKILESDLFRESHKKLYKKMIWQEGTYDIKLYVNYNENRTFCKTYTFTISNQDSKEIEKNINTSLFIKLNDMFRKEVYFKVIYKDFKEKIN